MLPLQVAEFAHPCDPVLAQQKVPERMELAAPVRMELAVPLPVRGAPPSENFMQKVQKVRAWTQPRIHAAL